MTSEPPYAASLAELADEGLDMIRLDIDRDGDVDGYCEACGVHFPAPEHYDALAVLRWALDHLRQHRVIILGRVVEKVST